MYRSKKRMSPQRGVVHSITIREVSIRGTEETLVEAEVEGLLVEEDEDRLSVITVINLDTWPMISRIHVHMHILQSTGSLDRRLSPTSCKVAGQRKPKPESESECADDISRKTQ
jgi:hypothetical protein